MQARTARPRSRGWAAALALAAVAGAVASGCEGAARTEKTPARDAAAPDANAPDAQSDAASAVDASQPADASADAAPALMHYTSKQGGFTVDAPAAAAVSETTLGVAWTLGAASYAVGYYDGKPRGVDRSSFYSLARDRVDGSEIEKEEDTKIGGYPTRLRRMRVQWLNKPTQWRRSAIIVVGDRSYDVSCTSTNPAHMTSPLTDAFFASFALLPRK